MFANLELGREEKDMAEGGLTLSKNPLLASIIDGCETLKALTAQKKLSPELIASAKGIILMQTNKIGFGISVTQGYGLVLLRLPNSQHGWSAPLPLKVDGFSLGAVAGYSEQHTAILVSSEEELQGFIKDKRAMKIGLDFGLSLGKKLNQNKTVDSSTVQKDDEGQTKTRAFTVSKGFIVDVSLKGTSVEPDADDIDAYYGEGTTPADILQGRIKPPRQAQLLYNALKALEGQVGAGVAGV